MPKQSPKYNVLILTNVRWWNATAFYAVNIGRILKKKGHRVFIGCHEDYPAFKIARSYGFEVVPISFSGFHIPTLMKNLLRMARFVKTNQIHIVNAHRSEDHTFAVLIKRLTGVKVVLTRGDRRRISHSPLSSLKYRLADAAIVTCRNLLVQNKHVFGPLKKKTAVIYGSIDEDHFKPTRPAWETRKKYLLDPDKKIIGLVGRLSPVKDPGTFIEAAAKVLDRQKNVSFIIAGKEVEIKTADLMRHIQQRNIQDHVLVLPHIDDIADLMNTFDVGVVTSTASETISRVLLEYMFLQKPVIGTKVNAIGEIIQPGINGELVAPGDATALSNKIIHLLENDGLRAEYGENSLKLYQRNYSEERFYDKTHQVFNKPSAKSYKPESLPSNP
jgi:glycosyltransferase involved in cell wall biosynthesis